MREEGKTGPRKGVLARSDGREIYWLHLALYGGLRGGQRVGRIGAVNMMLRRASGVCRSKVGARNGEQRNRLGKGAQSMVLEMYVMN